MKGTLQCWIRNYFEHSLHSTQPVKFNAAALQTMTVLHFDNISDYQATPWHTMSQLAAEWALYWTVVGNKNFFWFKHLPLPAPLSYLEDENYTWKPVRPHDTNATTTPRDNGDHHRDNTGS